LVIIRPSCSWGLIIGQEIYARSKREPVLGALRELLTEDVGHDDYDDGYAT
jgi:hypothetical protein